MEKEKGSVVWYNIEKGYGFISPETDEGIEKRDVYFSHKSLIDVRFPPEKGYRVSYGLITQKDGRKAAINVKVISDEK